MWPVDNKRAIATEACGDFLCMLQGHNEGGQSGYTEEAHRKGETQAAREKREEERERECLLAHCEEKVD